MFAGVADGNISRGALVAKISDHRRTVDERSDVMIGKRLGYVSFGLQYKLKWVGHTRIGDLLLVTFVLGLSCWKVSFRCGARLLDHSSSSSAREAMVRKEISCDAAAG